MLRSVAVIAVLAAAAEAKPAMSAKLAAQHRRFQKVNAKAIFNAVNGLAKPAVASGTDSCSQYTTEQRCQDVAAESDHCIWALPHGAQDDWEDEEDEVCRPMRCHDVDSVESSGDEALACASFLGGTCAFDQDSYVCWERGQTPDCEYRGAWESSMCPSPCVWDAGQYACNTPGSATPCGRAYDSTSCSAMATGGCTWTAGQTVDGWDECGVCYNRSRFSSGTPCDAYFGKPETCCPQANGCHWTVVMRPETEEPGMDDEGMVDDGDGRCTAQDEILACESYEDEDDCPRDRCNYIREDHYSGYCVPSGREVPCARLEARECSETTACLFHQGTTEEPGMDEDPDGACSDCPAGTNCTQSYVGPGGPDNGLPCASHTESNCPIERCAVGYGGGGGGDDTPDFNDWECSGAAGGGDDGGGTCRDPTCTDEFEQDGCSAKPGCAWNADCYTCYSTAAGDHFPCDKCFDTSSCSGSNGCTWQAAGSGCGDDIDGESGACIVTGGSIPCKSIEATSASCCPSPCHYDSATSTCNDASYQKSCESYGATVSGANGCPTSRCAVTLGICHSQSVVLTCTDICNQFLCTSSGSCHWDKDAESEGAQCTSGAANVAACNTLNEDNCYDEEQCAFIAGQCQDSVCSDIFSPEVCGAKAGVSNGNCAWHENTGCYFTGEDLPCGHYFESNDCPTDRCSYDNTCYLCLDSGESCPCHYFWGADECPSGRCTWTGSSCELDSGNIVPPALNGGGDSNMAHCTSAMQTALSPVLDAATGDCAATDQSPTATPDQLKCLDYYLTHASPASSFTAACPCLHYWAVHENPSEAFWMAVNC